jgi:hypothetical protein
MCRRLGLGHWNQVSFLAIADFASGSAGSDGSRMTHTRHTRLVQFWLNLVSRTGL